MERLQDSQAEVQERFELLVEKISGAVALTAEGTARLLVRLSVLATVAWILFTIAVTFYASFRYLYLPTSSHLAPVHLNYDTENGHPTAFVQLVPDDTYLLRSGQAYDVSVVLDVPETGVNKDLGVVMVNLELYSRKDGPARTSQRPIMLKYKSWLQDYLSTVALWPLTLVGLQQESQELYVFMFEDLIDSSAHPVTRAKVSLSKPVQVYHAQLRFDAHFTGLRHLMYWYPMTSGAVIVAVIFAFEALALLLLYAVLLYSWAAAKREGVCTPYAGDFDDDEFLDRDELDYESDSDINVMGMPGPAAGGGSAATSTDTGLGVEDVIRAADDSDPMGDGLRRRM